MLTDRLDIILIIDWVVKQKQKKNKKKNKKTNKHEYEHIICAVWSALLLFAAQIVWYVYSTNFQDSS